jgi:hypothetical protein
VAGPQGATTKTYEAALVHEAPESVLVERLYGEWCDTAARLPASELQVLVLCFLMAEEIEQKIASADRHAIRNVDPLPLLLEATRRALREYLVNHPFGSPEIESEVAGMWDEIILTHLQM